VWESGGIIIFKSFYEDGSVQIGEQERRGDLLVGVHGAVDQKQQVCGHQVHEKEI
jgi:hypothetical protein